MIRTAQLPAQHRRLLSSGTFTVNSTLTRYSATFSLPDLASRGLEVRLRVGTQTSGTWVVSRLQLEEGSIATDFNCGDYSEELVKCQRYAYCTNASGSDLIFITGICAMDGSNILSLIDLSIEMIASPILLISSASDFSFGGITGIPTAFNVISPGNKRLILLSATGTFSGSAVNLRLNVGSGFIRFLSHIP
jgi:hypothetical protein